MLGCLLVVRPVCRFSSLGLRVRTGALGTGVLGTGALSTGALGPDPSLTVFAAFPWLGLGQSMERGRTCPLMCTSLPGSFSGSKQPLCFCRLEGSEVGLYSDQRSVKEFRAAVWQWSAWLCR